MSDEPDGTSPTQSPPEPRRPAMRMVALLGGIVGGLAVAAREREKDELEHRLAERFVGAPLKRTREGAWTLADEPEGPRMAVALEPRTLTRDEHAAQEKRERRAEKARHDEERRVVGQNVAMEGMAKR